MNLPTDIGAAMMSAFVGLALVALAISGPTLNVSARGAETGTAIVVTTTTDELVDDGNCSLREAVQAANTRSVVDACVGDSETIELPAGTYTLTLAGANEDDNATGDLDIKNSVTIRGAGVSATVLDGNQLDRLLEVHAGATVVVTGVTITHGLAPRAPANEADAGRGADGGGIVNAGTLALSECLIIDNRAGDGGTASVECRNGGDGGDGGGVANTGRLSLAHCEIARNGAGAGGDASCLRPGLAGRGGGIYNSGNAIVEDTTVHANGTAAGGDFLTGPGPIRGSGGDGGGIYNAGDLTLDRSTVYGNQTCSGTDGGATHGYSGSGGNGGGIYNDKSFALNNSTISGNMTGRGGELSMFHPGAGGSGGGIFNAGVLTADNSTIYGNAAGPGGEGELSGDGPPGEGGGIYSATAVASWLRNTILAGNMSTGVGIDCSGILTSAGYNLLQTAGGCTIVGDLTGSNVGRDPLLRPLADNGGATWTHALAPGSAAIDAGSCTGIGGAVVAVDQRGAVRPQGTTCDIGAYEAPAFPKVHLPVVLR